MYRVGQAELDAIARVLWSGKLFRYQGEGQGHCVRFERRWARRLGVPHCTMTASGSSALTAALAGLGIGPGDEVIVPAHTYMATALSVLAVGAVPVIVDIDESVLLDPAAADAAAGPRTRAVIPVHMWGRVCDMDAIGAVAKRHNLIVVEDACQAVGGSFRGRAAGTIGAAGAYSFNYFKNLSCGEGGAVVTTDAVVAQRARCMADACGFFWGGKEADVQPFAASGNRASEIEGAMINAQLDRLDGILADLRRNHDALAEAVKGAGLRVAPSNDPAGDCGAKVMVQFDTPEEAAGFVERARAAGLSADVTATTRRHTYTDWDPVLNQRGAHHPALDPFKLQENAECRKDYRPDMCQRSLDILHRTVMVTVDPDEAAEHLRAIATDELLHARPTA